MKYRYPVVLYTEGHQCPKCQNHVPVRGIPDNWHCSCPLSTLQVRLSLKRDYKFRPYMFWFKSKADWVDFGPLPLIDALEMREIFSWHGIKKTFVECLK